MEISSIVRGKRYPKRYSRNLQNLRVIPTQTSSTNAQVFTIYPDTSYKPVASVNTVTVNETLTSNKVSNRNISNPAINRPGNFQTGKPINQPKKQHTFFIPNKQIPMQNYFNAKKYKRKGGMRKSKKQRKREAKKRAAMEAIKEQNKFKWTNPKLNQSLQQKTENNKEIGNTPLTTVKEDNVVEKTPLNTVKKNMKEVIENVPVDTYAEENCFEEIEVASYEYEGKQEIPVGFRRSKIHYLKYKKKLFFRPKIFNIGAQRTIINCLNLQDSQQDVDVVSEADYEAEYEEENYDDMEEKLNVIEEAEESEENEIEENKIKEKVIARKDIEVISLEKEKPAAHIFRTSISENKFGLKQDKCMVQKTLDFWKSHLIGLEYLIEVRNEDTKSVVNYSCVLCVEDVKVDDSPAVNIINHINKYKHVTKYLEKHFPACGYRFSENSNYDDNITVLQNICEEVNRSLVCYYMCIVDEKKYKNHKKEIHDIVNKSSHPNEENSDFDKTVLKKTAENILTEEITNIINDVIGHVLSSNKDDSNSKLDEVHTPPVPQKGAHQKITGKQTKEKKINKILNAVENDKSLKSEKKECNKKPVVKYNSSSLMASYLKLKYQKPKLLPKEEPQNKELPQNKEEKPVTKTIQKETVIQSQHEKSAVQTDMQKQTTVQSPEPVELIIIDSDDPETVDAEKSAKTLKETQKGKVQQKSSNHSKYCRKRISDKENTSLTDKSNVQELSTNSTKSSVTDSKINKSKQPIKTLSANSTSKDAKVSKSEPVTDDSNTNLRKPVTDKGKGVKSLSPKSTPASSTSKKIVNSSKKAASLKSNPTVVKEESKATIVKNAKVKSPVHKVVPISKSDNNTSKLVIESTKGNTKNKYAQDKIGKYSNSFEFPIQNIQTILRSPERRFPLERSSPVRMSSSERILMRLSRSPVKRITSPLRIIQQPFRRQSRSPPHGIHAKSPLGRHFVSPIRIHSKSPIRRHSRSPARKYSRLSRSPFRKYSRSPLSRHSRSPLSRHSRSPARRYSRSPARRHSRSPARRYSRSPARRYSRSPVRRHSRSPVRRHSRSPARRRSRSPVRRRSRSPARRRSRSPARRRSRSPIRRHSRSPIRRRSRSPIRRRSRSPIRRRSRSPVRKHSRSPVNIRIRSPLKISPRAKHRDDIKDERHVRKVSPGPSRTSSHYIDTHDSEYPKRRNVSKQLSPPRTISEKFIRSFTSAHERDITDLDPVSDEDESLYFNTSDKRQNLEDIKISDSTKAVLAQLLQKFSASDVNQNEPMLRKLMQFIESQGSNIHQSMTRSQSVGMSTPKVDLSAKEKNMILQQYLLSNLTGNTGGVPASPAMQFPQAGLPQFPRPPFVEEHPSPAYPLPPNITPQHPPPVHSQQFFPPNLNVPPPVQLPQMNRLPQELPPTQRVVPEVMFKDLKATVNKLFGANESITKQAVNPGVSSYVSQADPIKFDLNRPNSQKFGNPFGQKSMYVNQEKNTGFGGFSENPSARTEIPGLSYTSSGQFFSDKERLQKSSIPVPPPDAKVSFCDVSRGSAKGNLFPVVQSPSKQNTNPSSSRASVSDVKLSLAQRLASVLVKVGMIDVPAPLLQEMLMKIGAFSSSPPQDIREDEILSILKRLGYLK